ncbi:hypothetical protein LIER_27488 [Lithospermum erythrorhizon]|uniref:Cystatin domain-containing protein n=1 Tax=Lithospermum erythrorhizon TaxID=34254 RepID=A0AAV3RC77_LITER
MSSREGGPPYPGFVMFNPEGEESFGGPLTHEVQIKLFGEIKPLVSGPPQNPLFGKIKSLISGPPQKPYWFPRDAPCIELDVDDPIVVDYCNLAIAKYNAEKNTCYKNVKIISASKDSVGGGYRYDIVFQAKIDDEEPVTLLAILFERWNEITVTEVVDYPPKLPSWSEPLYSM